MERRKFISNTALGTLALALTPGIMGKENQVFNMPASRQPFSGIQIAGHCFYDEGMDYCLDLLQEKAAVNTLMVSFHAYYGAIGRPEKLVGDHGVPKKGDENRIIRRNWMEHNEKYYNNTTLRHLPVRKGVAYEDKNLMKDLLDNAHRRGMKVYERLYELHGEGLGKEFISGYETILETAIDGTKLSSPCVNNPDYQAWLAATMQDMFESYPLDGIQFGSETRDPLSGMVYGGQNPGCFCNHCMQRIANMGYDPEKAKEGVVKMAAYFNQLRASEKPNSEGVYPIFYRMLMEYPEILTWAHQWQKGRTDQQMLVYNTVKKANKNAQVGRHNAGQQNTRSFFFRAGTPVDEMAEGCDFIKPIIYHEIMGERLHKFLRSMGETFYKGVPKEMILDLYYALFQYDKNQQPSLANLSKTGLSPNYVEVETRRIVKEAKGKADVYPGIGIDIPKQTHSAWGDKPFKSNTEWLKEAVIKSFEVGATGVVACREYEEMDLSSLKAYGDAVKTIKI